RPKMPGISEKISHFIDHLEESGKDSEAKLIKILENEYRRRLNRYYLIDRLLRKKYNMSFEEFRDQDMVKKLNYSLEAESDFCDWEMAITGIECLQEDLTELVGNK
ncbi:MAG: hypothetical protein ACFFD2_30515, partial [Promethearchaeota archaeon]